MIDETLALPSPVQVVGAEDFAAIGLWAAAQRAELARLTKELRSLRVAISALADGGRLETDDSDPAPSDFAHVVDVMLDTAMDQLDAEAEAVRDEAATVVAGAMRDAIEMLALVGADDALVRRVTTQRPDAAAPLRRPRRAAELWRAAEAGRSSPRDDVTSTRAAGSSASALSIALSSDRSGALVGSDASQAHDLFWGTSLSDRPVRERLRRFGQRSQH